MREVRTLLLLEMGNPLLAQISVTRVILTKDLSSARIYYETSEKDRAAVTEELNKLKGAVRKELAHRMRLRAVPKLEFFYDETSETILRVERLIDSL